MIKKADVQACGHRSWGGGLAIAICSIGLHVCADEWVQPQIQNFQINANPSAWTLTFRTTPGLLYWLGSQLWHPRRLRQLGRHQPEQGGGLAASQQHDALERQPGKRSLSRLLHFHRLWRAHGRVSQRGNRQDRETGGKPPCRRADRRRGHGPHTGNTEPLHRQCARQDLLPSRIQPGLCRVGGVRFRKRR